MARGDYRRGELERQKEKVRETAEAGDITQADADAILDLGNYEEGNKADSTVRNHMMQARVTAERADIPLLDMTNSDLEELLSSMRSGAHPDVKDGGIVVRGYQATYRVFYRYHDSATAVDWDDIELDPSTSRDLTVEDLLYESDVDGLLKAARRANIRDMAFIGLALATGQRVDAVRTLRLKHVDTDGHTMSVKLNTTEGSLKGASGTKPLLWAKHFVRPWYESHPYKDDPDAALFCSGTTAGNGDNGPEAPMSGDTIRRMLRRRADEAGLDKDVYPHLLRHTAITRMVLEGLSEQKIKRIVGWSPDSSRFGTYVHLADNLTTDSVRRELGVPTSDSGTPNIGAPPLDKCPECNDDIPPDGERCPTCQTPFTSLEAEEGEPGRSPREMVADLSDSEKMELLGALRDELRN
jgi:integrase/recombinase XerD